MKKTLKIILISFLSLIALIFIISKVKRVSPLSWGHKEVNQPMFSNEAINGYDPVAYFTRGEAIVGNDSYSYEWKGANWVFSSEENKTQFMENPEMYTPQFGGYCAFATSKGFTANTDPNAFEIINNKLYLFADEGVKASWMESQAENLLKSEKNWN
ncbi:MAG: YHS domain protein [Cyclobacteriaceae bacterium]